MASVSKELTNFNAGGSSSAIKEMFFSPGTDTASDGTFSVSTKGATGNQFFTFQTPSDFNTLVSMEVYAYSIGTVSTVDIDLHSSYAKVGELSTLNQESDTTATYNFTTDTITAIDTSSVFTTLQANHLCGLNLDHNGIGTTLKYLMLKLRYT